MTRTPKEGNPLVVNSRGEEEAVATERRSVSDTLFTGSYAEIYSEVVQPFLEDVLLFKHEDLFARMITDKATPEDLDRAGRDEYGFDLSGSDAVEAIKFIDACVRSRFPAYTAYNPLDAFTEVTELQRVGAMGQGLINFFEAAGNISSALNDQFPRHPIAG